MNHDGLIATTDLRFAGRRYGLTLLGIALLLWCVGCGGGGGGSSFSTSPSGSQALVVGSADGTVLKAIQSQFQTMRGTGEEDPAHFAMVIFDGNSTTAAQLQANPGVMNFLAAGKPVVILNNTEEDRSVGLSGAVWAHAEGSAPATAWIYLQSSQPSSGGTTVVGQKHLEQIDFPVRIMGPLPGESPTLLKPSATDLQDDGLQWLAVLQQVIAGSAGNIDPSSCGEANAADCSNQTAQSFHDTQPLNITVPLVINGQLSPDSTLWGPNQPPQDSPFSTIQISGTFETRGYALLESAGGNYFHKIIVRQYLEVSPPPPPANQDWSSAFTHQITQLQPITGSCDIWVTPWPVVATLGWNDAVALDALLQNVPAGSVGITSNKPEVANNTTTLTTSDSHTETVGVSATAGIQNKSPVGTLSGSWSSSWTWGQAKTISIQDWEVTQGTTTDTDANYTYAAFANSSITDAILKSHALILPLGTNPASNDQLNNPNFCDLPYLGSLGAPKPPGLNGLQTNALTTQSETVWESHGLLPPQAVKLSSSGAITTGQVMDLVSNQGPAATAMQGCGGKCSGLEGLTGWITTQVPQTFDLDFSNPALQPPGWDTKMNASVPAPWALSFPPWPDKIAVNQPLAGTVTIPGNALNALLAAKQNILLSYVVEPLSALQTLPTAQACPGNQFNFNPGNNAVSNGSPPLQISSGSFKCSSGTCMAPVALTFQTAQTNQYSVQVVAWLPRMTALDGDTVISPQSAWCLDVPETTIQ